MKETKPMEAEIDDLLQKIYAQESERQPGLMSYEDWISRWGSFDPAASIQTLINTALNRQLDELEAAVHAMPIPPYREDSKIKHPRNWYRLGAEARYQNFRQAISNLRVKDNG